MLITLQKTNINDVETCYFMETSVAAYRITNYSLPRNLNWLLTFGYGFPPGSAIKKEEIRKVIVFGVPRGGVE